MNLANFQILLQEAIDNSTTTIDYLLLSKALQSLNMGQIRVVSTFANLPAAASNEGLLVWVTADERLYWSTGTEWYSITTNGKGILYSWGSDVLGSGSLGNNCTSTFSSPVSIVGGFTDWCAISVGSFHSLAIRTNGTLWAWGYNGSGRLGDGTVIARSSPVSVVGGFTNWCEIATGINHSVAVRTNGTAWAWGLGYAGRLGNNCTSNFSSPVSVVGGFTDWRKVGAGQQHTIGLRSNGTIWTWGRGICGLLGNNCTSNFSSPVSVVGGFTDWCAISTGSQSLHNLAIRTNGTLWAWGSGSSGMLGNNCTSDFSSPISVVGGFTDWCQVSAGNSHTAAVRCNGTLWAWGFGGYGRLGNNCTSDFSSPISVVGGFTNWCQVSAGGSHSVGLRTNGTIWAWGDNGGRLGNNCTASVSSPVAVTGGFTDWCQISAGASHTSAIRTTNFV